MKKVCHPESVENEPLRRNFRAVQDLAIVKFGYYCHVENDSPCWINFLILLTNFNM